MSNRTAPTPPFAFGPMSARLGALALPALLSNVSEPLLSLVDTAIIGHTSAHAMAGAGLTSNLFHILFWMLNFLPLGMSANVAQLLGAGQHEKALRIGLKTTLVSAALGLGAAVALVLGREGVFGFYGASATVFDATEVYFALRVAGLPLAMINVCLAGYLQGALDTRTPMVAVIGGAALNAPLAYGLVFGLGGWQGFGVAGAGLATLLAQSLSLAIFGRGMLRHQRLRQHAPRLVLRQVWQTPLHFVRGVGLDLFLRSASLNLVFLVSMRLAQQLGPFQAGAHNVTMQLWLFCAHFTDALAIALRSLTATALGAKNRALAMAWGRTGLWLGLFTGLGQTVVFALLSLWVGRWFTPDIHVLAALVLPYWLFVICQPMNAVSFVLDGVLKGAGDAAFLRKWLMVGAFVGFFPPALWLTPLRHDLLGVWLGIAALMGVRTVSITARFFSGRWMDASGRVYDVT